MVDPYEYVPGALIVTKTIAGPAAGQQGQVSIGVSCVFEGATTVLDPFVIPASQPAGLVSHTYEGIPAGSTCTVTETENGSTSTVSVETVGGNQTLAVPPGTKSWPMLRTPTTWPHRRRAGLRSPRRSRDRLPASRAQ